MDGTVTPEKAAAALRFYRHEAARHGLDTTYTACGCAHPPETLREIIESLETGAERYPGHHNGAVEVGWFCDELMIRRGGYPPSLPTRIDPLAFARALPETGNARSNTASWAVVLADRARDAVLAAAILRELDTHPDDARAVAEALGMLPQALSRTAKRLGIDVPKGKAGRPPKPSVGPRRGPTTKTRKG